MQINDTIVAQATPPGRGGVGIYVSGPKAAQVAEIVLGKLPKPRYADYLPFRDEEGSVLDQGIALYFLDQIHLREKMSLSYKDTVALLFLIYC